MKRLDRGSRLSTRVGVVAVAGMFLFAACGLAETGAVDSASDAGTHVLPDGPAEIGSGGAAPDADATSDTAGAAGEDVSSDAPSIDAAADGGDGSDAIDSGTCDGAVVGGHCWYAGVAGQSCAAVCAPHDGCDLGGTRDFAGSGGTDANCVAVLGALGFGTYPHQDFSNNDLGCHFAWGSWTYWSTALPTTCEASAGGQAQAVRMCACKG